MSKAYLLTGSNLGDREENLQNARNLIGLQAGQLEKISSVYETAAWGKQDQQSFLNQALLLDTRLNAHDLMKTLLNIESLLGRERKEKYGPRSIDIDILFFDQQVINDELLHVPHPEMTRRRFALVPLAEIAAAALHPVLHKSVTLLLEECADELGVKKLNSSL